MVGASNSSSRGSRHGDVGSTEAGLGHVNGAV